MFLLFVFFSFYPKLSLPSAHSKKEYKMQLGKKSHKKVELAINQNFKSRINLSSTPKEPASEKSSIITLVV